MTRKVSKEPRAGAAEAQEGSTPTGEKQYNTVPPETHHQRQLAHIRRAQQDTESGTDSGHTTWPRKTPQSKTEQHPPHSAESVTCTSER